MEPIPLPASETPTEYPSLSDRLQSTFIDLLFIMLLMYFFSEIMEKFEHVPDWIRMVLFVGIWILYEPICTSLGATIGNYIKGIRVRRFGNTEKRINIFQALIRYIIKLALGWFSFLTINTNPERRAMHDLAVGSVMIRK